MEKHKVGICEICSRPVFHDEGRECVWCEDGFHIAHLYHDGKRDKHALWKKKLVLQYKNIKRL